MLLSCAVGVASRVGLTAYYSSKTLGQKALVYNAVDMVVCGLASKLLIDRYVNGPQEQRLVDKRGRFVVKLLPRLLRITAGIAATALVCRHRMKFSKASLINIMTANLTLIAHLFNEYRKGVLTVSVTKMENEMTLKIARTCGLNFPIIF